MKSYFFNGGFGQFFFLSLLALIIKKSKAKNVHKFIFIILMLFLFSETENGGSIGKRFAFNNITYIWNMDMSDISIWKMCLWRSGKIDPIMQSSKSIFPFTEKRTRRKKRNETREETRFALIWMFSRVSFWRLLRDLQAFLRKQSLIWNIKMQIRGLGITTSSWIRLHDIIQTKADGDFLFVSFSFFGIGFYGCFLLLDWLSESLKENFLECGFEMN